MSNLAPVYAWGWSADRNSIDEFRDQIPGLGIIHYPHTYDRARPGDVCYVGNGSAAQKAARTPEVWNYAIMADERNQPGDGHPSGSYETPEAYHERIQGVYRTLADAGIPASTKGLAMLGGRFDDEYHREMKNLQPAEIRAANFFPEHYREIDVTLEINNRVDEWSLTIIPARANWWPIHRNTVLRYLYQEYLSIGFAGALNRYRDHPKVRGVGIWCLHEGRMSGGEWQAWHGLIDRHGELTWLGRVVKRTLATH